MHAYLGSKNISPKMSIRQSRESVIEIDKSSIDNLVEIDM